MQKNRLCFKLKLKAKMKAIRLENQNLINYSPVAIAIKLNCFTNVANYHKD